jgi:hypothetical protein
MHRFAVGTKGARIRRIAWQKHLKEMLENPCE